MKRSNDLDYGEIRARVGRGDSASMWRSLEELAATPEFEETLHREFPEGASEWYDEVSRRSFLKVMGASLALAGYTGCGRPPEEKVVPYVTPPEAVVPGKPLFFATAMPLSGYGRGVIVESHEGRPTKVEGNPDHPASLGSTDVFMQASVLDLYDPDRSQLFINRGNPSDWGTFVEAVSTKMASVGGAGGRGLRILTETITSPSLGDALQQLLKKFPQAKWHQWNPINRDNVHEGTRLAFGQVVNPTYRFDRAKVILSLDSDFLADEPGSIRYAREFIDARRVREGRAEMNRLYVVEPTPTITGSMADHRLRLKASDVEAYARRLARALGVQLSSQREEAGQAPAWITAVADDLKSSRGAGLVIAGPCQPPAVHAIAHAINESLGNVGQTVVFTEPVEANPVNHRESITSLVRDMESGSVELLVILGGNPVYTAPAELNFGEKLLAWAKEKAPDGSPRHLAVHLSLHDDETSYLCHWHVPQTHYLESWGDVRAYDGTVSIIQPLIAPLYRGRSDHEIIAMLAGRLDVTGHDLVRSYWRERTGEQSFDVTWDRWLEKGVVPNTAAPPRQVRLGNLTTLPAASASAPATAPAGAPPEGAFEIVFRPDPTVWDGSFANNGWQQELPKPITHLTWDNAALVSFSTAEKLRLQTGNLIVLNYRGRQVEAPVLVVSGQHDDVIAVTLGYGRTRGGSLASPGGKPIGFNAYALRTADAPWFGSGLSITHTGRGMRLATTRNHFLINAGGPRQPVLQPETVAIATAPHTEVEEKNRRLVRVGTLETFKANPQFVKDMEPEPSKPPLNSLLPNYEYKEYKWAMAIDINACIACNACVVACQSENNIPVVGKEQVLRGREMHWIRIDPYQEGSPEDPRMYHQPVPCMHCETAPCELVCPVGATVHDSEGLNEMVYNRCVGTRYCSNNCPYKVRRFNFLSYSDYKNPTVAMQKNPNVTVRARGVMEKCSYCIQRIAAARIAAEKQNRRIRDGEVQTACQQACPTRAIVFGDMNDPKSEVARVKNGPLDYGILTELTTIPRTTYEARLWNPNPAMKGGEPA